MRIKPPKMKLTATCSTCHEEKAVNVYAYNLLVGGREFTCKECRSNGRKWTAQTYQDYLQSDHWKAFKLRAFRHYSRKCYLCGDMNAQIELHHNDYSRLGGESLSDVIPLCRDCHERHHGHDI